MWIHNNLIDIITVRHDFCEGTVNISTSNMSNWVLVPNRHQERTRLLSFLTTTLHGSTTIHKNNRYKDKHWTLATYNQSYCSELWTAPCHGHLPLCQSDQYNRTTASFGPLAGSPVTTSAHATKGTKGSVINRIQDIFSIQRARPHAIIHYTVPCHIIHPSVLTAQCSRTQPRNLRSHFSLPVGYESQIFSS
jgi:hypothetical protein